MIRGLAGRKKNGGDAAPGAVVVTVGGGRTGEAPHAGPVDDTSPAHVTFDGVSKVFGDVTATAAVTALEDVSFTVGSREFLAIVGPSGCGKSTVLNILAGLDAPTSGRVLVHDEEIPERRGRFGYMFQKDLLFPWRTIVDNVALGLEVRGASVRDRRARARALLNRFGLARFADKYPAQLSGGMRQRAALMRTLLSDADCLLLDEPFAALDALMRSVMQEWLLSIWEREHRTVVFITHDIEEAVFLSDRVLIMSARPGRIKDAFDVPLERPRDHRIVTSEAFTRLKGRVLEQIHDESLLADDDLLTSDRGRPGQVTP